MMRKSLLICAMAAASPVLAEGPVAAGNLSMAFQCNFETECYETEPCQDSGYEMDVAVSVGTLTMTANGEKVSRVVGRMVLSSVAQNDIPMGVELASIDQAANQPITGAALKDGTAHLLSRSADGAARYTVIHQDDPVSIAYFGTCTETK